MPSDLRVERDRARADRRAGRVARSICLLLLIGCAHASAVRSGVEAEILNLERLRREAQLRGDWRAIQSINAPDFTEIGGNGAIRTAAENAESMRAGVLKFATVDYSDQQVRTYGEVAFVTGVGRRTGSYGGTPFQQHFRYTRIYVRSGGSWKAVFAQNTPIDVPAR